MAFIRRFFRKIKTILQEFEKRFNEECAQLEKEGIDVTTFFNGDNQPF